MMDEQLDLLDLPLFDLADAARVLELGSTLTYWLLGGERRGVVYDPPLRPELNHDRTVTWGEFIEAALLRELRKVHKVSLREARQLRADLILRAPFVRYPLAVHDVYVNGRRLAGALRSAGLDASLAVEPSTGTIRSGTFVDTFLRRVTWEEAVPVRYQPSLDFDRVAIEPGRQFGAPQVAGMRTHAIFELVEEAGMEPAEIADLRGLSLEDIDQAVGYERGLLAAA